MLLQVMFLTSHATAKLQGRLNWNADTVLPNKSVSLVSLASNKQIGYAFFAKTEPLEKTEVYSAEMSGTCLPLLTLCVAQELC